jgi:uncharacterized protein YbaR (Trm112 family)/SAM-dependent methyltransferase|tara:strand:- start:2436 stop:3878 length:1443 start_codon:yes stop_codon:yes gene_type:complete
MKLSLLEHLRCPTCAGHLILKNILQKIIDLSVEDRRKCLDRSIDVALAETVTEEGVLLCHKCSVWYAIINFVPVLLTFPTKLQEKFYNRHKMQIDELGFFTVPSGMPLPGERSIQKSFTREWSDFGVRDVKFEQTQEELEQHLRVELDWPEWVLRTSGKRFLEVGAGLCQESMSFEELTGDEIFAVDLNLAIINVGGLISKKPFIHVVVASLFKMPFPKRHFDIVFSNGVLHHTFSTRAAFHSILRHMQEKGMAYIWIYAHEIKFRSLKRIPHDLLESYARPIIARLPILLQNLFVYPIALFHYLRFRSRLQKYQFVNAVHEVRDNWTPLYAHHESIIRTIEWFQEEGLEYRLLDTVKYRQLVGRRMYSGFGIRGIESATASASESKHLFRFIDSSTPDFLCEVSKLFRTRKRRKLAVFSLRLWRKYMTIGSQLLRLSIPVGFFLLNTPKEHKWTAHRLCELLSTAENMDFLIRKLEGRE